MFNRMTQVSILTDSKQLAHILSVSGKRLACERYVQAPCSNLKIVDLYTYFDYILGTLLV